VRGPVTLNNEIRDNGESRSDGFRDQAAIPENFRVAALGESSQARQPLPAIVHCELRRAGPSSALGVEEHRRAGASRSLGVILNAEFRREMQAPSRMQSRSEF
jgi:hypothetical protein